MVKIVNSWNEWDPLKHVIVGRADGCCIPPSEPATDAKIPEDSDMKGMSGPRSIESIEKANIQLDNFANILEKEAFKLIVPLQLILIKKFQLQTGIMDLCLAVCLHVMLF